MPNWCHNLLTVHGDRTHVADFAARARPDRAWAERVYRNRKEPRPFDEWYAEWRQRNPLSFNSFVPHPPDDVAGRDWREENWGTKWDANFTAQAILSYEEGDPEASLDANGVVVTDETLIYKFQTAWSPPESAVAAMAAQYPMLELVLRYAEYGEGYAGEVRFANGELESDDELDLDDAFAPEERWF